MPAPADLGKVYDRYEEGNVREVPRMTSALG